MVYKIPARTLFIGKNLVYVPECHSTNSLAYDLAQKGVTPEGTVVITDHQTAGRGQRGNTWSSGQGQNFTFSIVLRPTFLQVPHQFDLTVAISLAVHDYVASIIPQGVAIKWPNDLLLGHQKVCGMLIENQIQGAVYAAAIVGIGLNMNQSDFDIPGATSVGKVAGKSFDLTTELESLLGHVESRYLLLRQGQVKRLRQDYLEHLYHFQAHQTFLQNGEKFDAVIEDVDQEGRLVLNRNGQVQKVMFKEVQFVL